MSDDSSARGFVRFLYTQNPFYLLSACLTLYGLHVAFRAAGGTDNPWPLAAALGGYTVLLAATGFVLVRFGKIWDDARSILIIVLLLLVGLSVSFDEVCNTSPAAARGVLAFGLVLSLAVSETILRGLGIRLSVGYRGPFYLMLALFFGYPLWVSSAVNELEREAVLWRIFLFPAAAGFVFLTLLPAIRKGSAAARDNGTPWRWPLFPGTIFFFLAIGVVIRSNVLCLSFDPQVGLESVFGLYFLLPFALALGIVLLELARAESYRKLSIFVLAAAPLALLATLAGGAGEAHEQFLAQVTETAGSPLWYAMLGLAGLYGYAWRLGYCSAEAGLSLALAGLCFVSPETRNLREVEFTNWWPLALVAGLQGGLAVRNRTSCRTLIALWSAIAAASVGLRHTEFVAWHGAAPWHLAFASLLVVGFLFHDDFAKALRRLGATCFMCAGLAVAIYLLVARESAPWLAAYLLALAVLAVHCGSKPVDCWFRVAAVLDALAGWASLMVATTNSLHERLPPHAVYSLEIGVVCFGIAVSISLAKTGWLKVICLWGARWLGLDMSSSDSSAKGI